MIESEFILLRQFASNGDAEAFAKIIKQHASMVYGVCLRILQDRDKAADAVQDTFFQLVRDAAEITGPLPNWLHRVATYRAIDLIRTESQRKQRESIYTENYRNIGSQDEKAAWREISSYIDEELDNLDELTREVLILHFFESQTMTSIAEKFCISQQTVSRRIDSGVVSLRQNLKSRGVIIPAAIFTALLSENIVKAAPASVMKELGKIAIAGCRDARELGHPLREPYVSNIASKIASSISTGIAVKTKIMVGVLIVLLGAGLTVVSSFIANGENKSAWELVNSSLRKVPETIDTNSVVKLSAREILQKYTESQEKFKSFILKYDCEYTASNKLPFRDDRGEETHYAKGGYIGDFKSDGKKHLFSVKYWEENKPYVSESREIVKNDPRVLCTTWNGKNRYQYLHSNAEPSNDSVYLVRGNDYNSEEDSLGKRNYITRLWGVVENGYTSEAKMRIDEELNHAETISVQPQMEEIQGSQCYVLNASTKNSVFKIWIDPQHGYNIAQVTTSRGGEGTNFGKPEEISLTAYIKNVKFEQKGDVWIPIEGDYGFDRKTIQNGFEIEDYHLKITSFELNPNHEALGSFEPDFIRNSSRVFIIGLGGITYIWQDGKVKDSYGYEVNLSNLKQESLLGKTLPSLAEFGVNLEPDVFRNNKLLICFFDYSQRPSRNCVLTLNEKTQSLLDKDIFLIFIQAEPVTEKTLDNWLKQNKIMSSVGTSKIDLHALDMRWGVKALPWLILTDKNHIVTDEGFSITELDEKIKD